MKHVRSVNEAEADSTSDNDCIEASIKNCCFSLFPRSNSSTTASGNTCPITTCDEENDTTFIAHIQNPWFTKKIMTFVTRSYDDNDWFYLVAKPYDDKYEKYEHWYKDRLFPQNVVRRIQKMILSEKESVKVLSYFYVVEKDSAKPHVNIIFTLPKKYTNQVLAMHNRNMYRSRYHVEQLQDLGDRIRVADYIIKETKIREFTKKIDFDYRY